MFLELAESVTGGNTDPLKAYVALKKAEQEISDALKIVQPLAIDAANNYPEKTIKFSDAIIEKRSTPATWDYSECAAYSQAKEKLKQIEKIAQAGGAVDSDSGEIIGKAFRIEGKSSIAVKLLKQEA